MIELCLYIFALKLHKMKFLNLSNGLHRTPAIAHEVFVFSGGEPHIKIADTAGVGERVCITVQARSAQDVVLVLLAHDALRRVGAKWVELYIPYFPAARQDRVMVPGEPLSARVYAQMLQSAPFDAITVFDAHSEVVPALLERGRNVSNHGYVRSVIEQVQRPGAPLALVAPDAGAAKKIHHLAAALQWPHVVQCDKTRDVRTGVLSAPKVFADDLQGADCLIVDDICDGGGTFIQLSDALRAKNAGRLYLAVSHGIFSKGIEVLQPHFDRVFCTDSFCQLDSNNFLTVAPTAAFL
jgi:ribose-phosphate pyrophosphokinase